MNYNYPEHHAKNLDSALKLVKYLKESGKYDLFRGQNHTFPLCPSIARKPDMAEINTELLERFASWVHKQGTLSSLHNNLDAIIAVAQHYGMPTPFLDFTTEPEVAAFFASDTGSAPRGKQTACILCLNRAAFEESWKDMNARYHADCGHSLVRLVDIDVQNLWRLHAQSGLFIDMRVDADTFEMFSGMLHIYFPLPDYHDPNLNDKYYPKNKSHIELLLDQHFLIETYDERAKKLELFFGATIQAGDLERLGEEKVFHHGQLPDVHPSWSEAELVSWRHEPNEVYNGNISSNIYALTVDITNDVKTAAAFIHTQIMEVLEKEHARKRLSVSWIVKDQAGILLYESEADEGDEPRLLGEVVQLLFDGMRSKPYEDTEVASAIANYIVLNCYQSWEGMQELWGNIIGIELDGGNVRARGFCGELALVNALRSDLEELLTPGALVEFKDQGVEFALSRLIDPSRLFEFNSFRKMFAEEVIPTTALIRVEGYVLHYNIADLRVFGLS